MLIVLPGAVGDVVRGLPLLGRLRHAWPQARIGWAVEHPSAPLLESHPWLDVVHVLARRSGLPSFVRFLAVLRRERYDLALDLGRGLKSACMVRASGAPRRVGLHRSDAREGSWLAANEQLPPQGVATPKLLQFVAFAEHLGVPPAPIDFGLVPTPAEVRAADTLLEGLAPPIVVASVGSSCPSRYWWPARTAAVLDALAERQGASAVLTGTAADAEFARAVARHMRAPVRDLVGRTSLRELVAVLARAAAVFGPDSGALHVAAAVGVPVVSLWGATSAERSTPWGQERGVVRGEAPCAPCFLRDCPIGRVCMRAIDVDTVTERVATMLRAA
ncbi:MAG TPA: glycosyltransferase family 9 protein [Vicinamibacterales bacterium]|nr:glycosyltransferase family 9 protein [Vicinamibacterales bacterium]